MFSHSQMNKSYRLCIDFVLENGKLHGFGSNLTLVGRLGKFCTVLFQLSLLHQINLTVVFVVLLAHLYVPGNFHENGYSDRNSR